MITLSRPRPEGCLSDLALDHLMAGRPASPEEVAHLGGCAACQARRAELELGRATPLPPLVLRPIVPLPVRRWRGPLALLTAAAAAILVVIAQPSERTQTKGGPALGFYVSHGGQVRRGADHELVSPGDALRFVYSADRPNYLAVLGQDAAGKVSVYYPGGGETLAAASAGQALPLDSSVTLDGTLGSERILGFFCRTPRAIAPLVEAVARGEETPEGCQRVELAIEKKP